MTSRTEQIIESITNSVTGLLTTENRVYRGRVYPLRRADTPGLCVYMGDDRIADELESTYIDWDLTVIVECYVKSHDRQIDTVINRVRSEVHEAVMLDYTQGLNFVIETTPEIAAQPEMSGEGRQPVAVCRLEYTVRYRTSRNSLDR